MKLLAMLLALGVERLFSARRDAQGRHRIWDRLHAALPAEFWSSPALPPLAVLLPALCVFWIQRTLGDDGVGMLFAAAVLFACLGPRDLADDVQRLRAARAAGDGATVARLTRTLQMGPEPDADHRSLLGALFIQSHERLFGALWWFLALGRQAPRPIAWPAACRT